MTLFEVWLLDRVVLGAMECDHDDDGRFEVYVYKHRNRSMYRYT